MAGIGKTIFISYRRECSDYAARLVKDNLVQNGYDVFMDMDDLVDGEFEPMLMHQIAAREFFVVLLALESTRRFRDPADVMRKEIELAIKLKRRVIPLFQDQFSFKAVSDDLVGMTAELTKYNAIPIPSYFFYEAMDKLREKFIKDYDDRVVLTRVSPEESKIFGKKLSLVLTETDTTLDHVKAEEYLNKGRARLQDDYTGRIKDFNQAIKLYPFFAEAYFYRGNVYARKQDSAKAIADYSKAIELNPKLPETFHNRGAIYLGNGNFPEALNDFAEAIRLNKHYDQAYIKRGMTHSKMGKYKNAVADFTQALTYDPDDKTSLYERGSAQYELKEYAKASKDFERVVELNPQDAAAYYMLGNIYRIKKDSGKAKEYYGWVTKLHSESKFPLFFENLGDCAYDLSNENPLLNHEDATVALNAYEYFLRINPHASNKAQIMRRIEELKKRLGL